MTITARTAWVAPFVVLLVTLGAQCWLVARAGTDVPFQDQWDVEGRLLYPAWREGTLRTADLLGAHNEHRIVWTRLLDLALFSLDGQWDPLVQLAAGAVVRAAGAAVLAWALGQGWRATGRWLAASGVAVAFLPHLAWMNALWGFQSQVYFVLLFSLLALVWLGSREPSRPRQIAGLAAGGAALVAMGAGGLVPVALLGLFALRMLEQRRLAAVGWREGGPVLLLLAAAWALRVEVPEHAALRAATTGEFFNAFGRALAWPHVWQPWAAFGLNLPLVWLVGARLAARRRAGAGEDFVVALGGWGVVMAGAMAWTRGGGDEFAAGVPSRYVDFLVLVPVANAWCAVALAREVAVRWRASARLLAVAWGVFVLAGWLGLSAQMLRGVILPRIHDRDAPVRLVRAFQMTGDAAVFAGQPRLLVPHPNPESVRTVLADPRLRGALPPSLQPERPMGPLSRGVRVLLMRQ
jgi:hypothetical protein